MLSRSLILFSFLFQRTWEPATRTESQPGRGPCLKAVLEGGVGGMAHRLAHFRSLPWESMWGLGSPSQRLWFGWGLSDGQLLQTLRTRPCPLWLPWVLTWYSRFFCEGPDSRSFRLCRSCGLCHSYSFLPSWSASRHRPESPERRPGPPNGCEPGESTLTRVAGEPGLAEGPSRPTLLRRIHPSVLGLESATCLDFCFGKHVPELQNQWFSQSSSPLNFFFLSKTWISYILLAVRKTWST